MGSYFPELAICGCHCYTFSFVLWFSSYILQLVSGLGSWLSGMLESVEQVMEKVGEEMEEGFDEVMDGKDPDDLPENYDNSTSQVRSFKINDSSTNIFFIVI